MPITTSGTTITFNDATTQTTSAVTSVSAGTGISVAGGKTPTVTNTGVTSIVAGTGISISGGTGAVTVTNTTTAPNSAQLCKAWIRFLGQSSNTIQGSYNISSITDRGGGIYTLNFTTALADSGYSVAGVGEWTGGVSNAGVIALTRNYPPATTNVTITYSGVGGGTSLYYYVNASVFGN